MESKGNELILEGALNHVMESRAALRWVVLEKNLELGHVYLSIYRKSPAMKSDLKKRYEFTESNFIGTERGTIKTQNTKRSMLYWAIILKHESILFNDKEALDKSASQFENWNEEVKKLFNHQSWEVSPLQGSAIKPHPKLVLHLNTSSLCLALLSPPRHFLRWPLTNITDCDCHDCIFSFQVIGDDAPGYYEVKVTRSKHASKIKTVCNDLRQVNNGENTEPPLPSIRQFSTILLEDRKEIESLQAARNPLDLHQHRNSNASTSSTHSARDTLSVASFDSAASTPSPTPQKGDNNVISNNPFTFPPDGVHNKYLGDTLFVPDPVVSPAISLDQMAKPVSKPRTPSPKPKTPSPKPRTPSPSSPYRVVCVDPHTHTSHVTPCIISDIHPSRPLSPPSTTMENSTATPDRTTPWSTPDRTTPWSTPDRTTPWSTPDRTTPWSTIPRRTNDEGFCEGKDPKQKSEVTYSNTFDNTDVVNLETEPRESNTYMNFDENNHYQNPIPKKKPEKDNVGPKVAPKPQAPNPPPRKRELHELIQQARMGKTLIKDFTTSIGAWKYFCLLFSIKKDSYPIKDWRALAEKLGLKMTDMELVEHTSGKPGICTSTEIVLAYWQSNPPDDMPFTKEQLVYELQMLDRHDMVAIFQQGDEQT